MVMRRFVRRKKRVVAHRRKNVSSEMRSFVAHSKIHKSSDYKLRGIQESFDFVEADKSGLDHYKDVKISEWTTKLAHLKEDMQKYYTERTTSMTTLAFFEHGLVAQLKEVNYLNEMIDAKCTCIVDLVVEIEQMKHDGHGFQDIITDSDRQLSAIQNAALDKYDINFQGKLENNVSPVKCIGVEHTQYESTKPSVVLTRRSC